MAHGYGFTQTVSCHTGYMYMHPALTSQHSAQVSGLTQLCRLNESLTGVWATAESCVVCSCVGARKRSRRGAAGRVATRHSRRGSRRARRRANGKSLPLTKRKVSGVGRVFFPDGLPYGLPDGLPQWREPSSPHLYMDISNFRIAVPVEKCMRPHKRHGHTGHGTYVGGAHARLRIISPLLDLPLRIANVEPSTPAAKAGGAARTTVSITCYLVWASAEANKARVDFRRGWQRCRRWCVALL